MVNILSALNLCQVSQDLWLKVAFFRINSLLVRKDFLKHVQLGIWLAAWRCWTLSFPVAMGHGQFYYKVNYIQVDAVFRSFAQLLCSSFSVIRKYKCLSNFIQCRGQIPVINCCNSVCSKKAVVIYLSWGYTSSCFLFPWSCLLGYYVVAKHSILYYLLNL